MLAVLVIIAVLIAASVLPVKVVLMLLRPQLRSNDEIIREETADGSISSAVLHQEWKDFETRTSDSVMIRGSFIEGAASDWIIFCHGITGTAASSLKYTEPFLNAGWGTVIFDFRGHGRSGAGLPSYGFRERLDLGAVADFIRRTFPDARIHLYGISMGAATVLQYLPGDPGIVSAAADSSFTSLSDQLLFRFHDAGLPQIIYPALLSAASLFLRVLGRLPLKAVNPMQSASAVSTPLLLIHADDDPEVPSHMCGMIAAGRPSDAVTAVFRPAGGGHTRSAVVMREQWKARVSAFFNL